MTKTIEAVIKVSERCNIDCTYCYFFNKGDNSFEIHPAYITEDMMRSVAIFLLEGAQSQGATEVAIDFHGGEPLMLKKSLFERHCDLLTSIISPQASISFSVQTNAMLIDAEWIDILERHQFSIGVSLDGVREVNDRARIDKRGRGTYDRTIKGLALVRDARREGRIRNFGVLSVALPDVSGKEAFTHLVDDLGISNLDFLLPIDPVAGIPQSDVEGYAQFLCDAFDAWIEKADRHVHVRLFRNTMNFLSHGRAVSDGSKAARAGDYKIISIASNGDIGPDDTLRTLDLSLFDHHNVQSSSLDVYWSSPEISALQKAEVTIPDACASCCWKFHCRGGAENGRIINRFDPPSGFNNASGMCNALRLFYTHVAAYMLQNGLSYEKLTESLEVSEEGYNGYEEACEFSDYRRTMKTQGSLEVIFAA